MDNLNFDKIDIQSYLNNSKINPQLAQKLFKWRTRMTNFKCNFRNGNDDLSCSMGCNEDDSQENLLNCQIIKSQLPELSTTNSQYSDIFSNDIMKMKSAGALLDKALKVREAIIDTQ